MRKWKRLWFVNGTFEWFQGGIKAIITNSNCQKYRKCPTSLLCAGTFYKVFIISYHLTGYMKYSSKCLFSRMLQQYWIFYESSQFSFIHCSHIHVARCSWHYYIIMSPQTSPHIFWNHTLSKKNHWMNEISCSWCCKVKSLFNDWKFHHWASNVLVQWMKIQWKFSTMTK